MPPVVFVALFTVTTKTLTVSLWLNIQLFLSRVANFPYQTLHISQKLSF